MSQCTTSCSQSIQTTIVSWLFWWHFLLVFLPSVLWHCWLGGRKGIRPVKTEWWGAGIAICLERGADLHTAQLMPLPLTVSCFSEIQIGFTFLVPAHVGSAGQGPHVCFWCFLLPACTAWSWSVWQLLGNVGRCLHRVHAASQTTSWRDLRQHRGALSRATSPPRLSALRATAKLTPSSRSLWVMDACTVATTMLLCCPTTDTESGSASSSPSMEYVELPAFAYRFSSTAMYRIRFVVAVVV